MRTQAKPKKRFPSEGVKMSKRSITEPDMALTTQEILRHHVAPNGYTIKPQNYDPTGIMNQIHGMSKTEREDKLQQTSRDVKKLSAKAQKEANEQAEAQRKAQEEAQKQANAENTPKAQHVYYLLNTCQMTPSHHSNKKQKKTKNKKDAEHAV